MVNLLSTKKRCSLPHSISSIHLICGVRVVKMHKFYVPLFVTLSIFVIGSLPQLSIAENANTPAPYDGEGSDLDVRMLLKQLKLPGVLSAVGMLVGNVLCSLGPLVEDLLTFLLGIVFSLLNALDSTKSLSGGVKSVLDAVSSLFVWFQILRSV